MQDDAQTAARTEAKKPAECTECGAPYARQWHTAEGIATLCPTCAQFFGLGCP